jgi:hypothetical protein
MREEILKLQALGRMPTESIENDESIVSLIEKYDELLTNIKKPLNYDEGLALIKLFPDGFFYDLHWDLLQLIESLYGKISNEKYLELISQCTSKEWNEMLINRYNNGIKNPVSTPTDADL